MNGPETGNRLEHTAFSYLDDEHYLEGIRSFLKPALEAADPVLVAVPPDRLATLREELADDAEPVQFLDITVAGRNPGRIIPAVLIPFADSYPDRRVWMVGESIWSQRSAEEYPACVVHEALINVALADRDAVVLCLYDANSLGSRALRDAVRTHPVLLERTGRRISHSYCDPVSTAAGFCPPIPPPADAEVFDFTDERGLAPLRRFVSRRAIDAELSTEQVSAIVMAVNELAANTVEHTTRPGRLTTWHQDGRLVCQLDDSGHIKDPLAGRIPAPLDDEGGRGLLLANELCDLVRIHTGPGGTSIRLYIDPREDGPEQD